MTPLFGIGIGLMVVGLLAAVVVAYRSPPAFASFRGRLGAFLAALLCVGLALQLVDSVVSNDFLKALLLGAAIVEVLLLVVAIRRGASTLRR